MYGPEYLDGGLIALISVNVAMSSDAAKAETARRIVKEKRRNLNCLFFSLETREKDIDEFPGAGLE